MPKLNQIIAVEKGVKSKSLQELTQAHHDLQKPALLAGISRTYQPKELDTAPGPRHCLSVPFPRIE